MNLERLKELMSKATPGPWEGIGLTGPQELAIFLPKDDWKSMDSFDESLIIEAINSLPDLIRKAEAGEKLAKEIKDIDGTEYCGHQLDLALAAYDAMVKGE